MRIIPFDFFDGRTAGECHSILLEQRELIKGMDRDAIKDDCKLIAQIFNRSIEGYITKDQKSFERIIKPIQERKQHSLIFIDLTIPLKNFIGTLF
jgi:predicted nucleic acid-binding protein